MSRLAAIANDFSQTGTSLNFGSTPSNWLARDNFGSTGFASRKGGTASVANGGTIAHGLGDAAAPITPSSVALTPTTAKRIAAVTGRGTTNVTVALHDDMGTAITSAESVGWWAEQ